MDSGDYSPGTFAVYRGHRYKTGGGRAILPRITLLREGDDDPVPEGLEPYGNAPARAYFVHPDQLDAWYTTTSRFRWKGASFATMGIKAGRATGRFLGADGPFPELRDLEQVELTVFIGTFPVDEITDLTEHREDLLARWKEQRQS